MIKILKLFKIIILLNIFYFSFLSISYPCSFNCPKSELFKDDENIQELIVKKGFGKIYKRYSHQCDWSKNS